MNITIQSKNINLSTDEKSLINKSIMANFSRVQEKIKSISVHLTDINGPKGGQDKQCTIIVNSTSTSPVVVKEKQSNAGQAARFALSRASKAFSAKVKRHLSYRKKPTSQRTEIEQSIENEEL